MIENISKADQKLIDNLRVDLSLAMINLNEVVVCDSESIRKKSHVIEGLRMIGRQLDGLGLRHSTALNFNEGIKREQTEGTE